MTYTKRINGTQQNARTGKKGWRLTENGYVYFRSQTEANFAFFLDYIGVAWQYEPKTFWFEKIKRGVRSYTPDFYIIGDDEYIEVKGWMDAKSKTKLKRLAKYYPDIKLRLIDTRAYRAIEKRYAREIPLWNDEGWMIKPV